MSSSSPDPIERAAHFIVSSEDYRVLRKRRHLRHFHEPIPDAASRLGVAVDVETTGLDSATDKIIELAVQRFRYDETGHIVEVGRPRVWPEDPDCDLDPRITKLTGLTAEMLKGQPTEEEMAIEILSSADLRASYRVNPVDAPFEAKDRLKARGYRWNAILCFWSKEVPESDRLSEDGCLKTEVYTGYGEAAFIAVSAYDRYTGS